MSFQEEQWELDVVKQRYEQLGLSDEQARLIVRFEKENNSMIGKVYFTNFEEIDYQNWFFSGLLRPEQYVLFEKDQEKVLRQTIEEIRKDDFYHELNVSWTERKFNYYKDELLPALFSIPILASPIYGGNDRPKLDFLRDSYRIFLSGQKKELLVEHFRFNRMYNPGRLKQALKQLELSYLWPDYSGFLHRADAPTRAVCQYVEVKARSIVRLRGADYFGDALNRLEAFYAEEGERRKKDISDDWPIIEIPDHITEEEKINHLGMQVLLCDRTAYGLLPERALGGEIKEA